MNVRIEDGMVVHTVRWYEEGKFDGVLVTFKQDPKGFLDWLMNNGQQKEMDELLKTEVGKRAYIDFYKQNREKEMHYGRI